MKRQLEVWGVWHGRRAPGVDPERPGAFKSEALFVVRAATAAEARAYVADVLGKSKRTLIVEQLRGGEGVLVENWRAVQHVAS